MKDALLTIDFWDVGQGDCTTIKLPNGKYIIIDTGPKGSPLVDWFSGRIGQTAEIHGIILTHNDADHAGALPSIVEQKGSQIGEIWMLVDRNTNCPKFQKIFRAAQEGENKGCYEITHAVRGQVIWSDDASQSTIKIIHPGFSANVDSKNPNDTSAAIILKVQGKTLAAWPGDLKLSRTSEILTPLKPELVVGPHHGGPSDFLSKSVRKKLLPRTVEKRKEEYKANVTALSPKRSWISVGTNNNHHHPRPGHLDTLAQTGCRVVCSQITNACDRASIRNAKHVFQGSGALGLPAPRTGVSCRGTMRIFVKDGNLHADAFEQVHLEKVSNLHRPRCLRATGCKKGDDLPSFS